MACRRRPRALDRGALLLAGKKIVSESGKIYYNPAMDITAEIMQLYRQLPETQRKIMILSAALSACGQPDAAQPADQPSHTAR